MDYKKAFIFVKKKNIYIKTVFTFFPSIHNMPAMAYYIYLAKNSFAIKTY